MTTSSLLLSADTLAQQLQQADVQIISSCKPQVHKQASITGAIFLHGSELTHTQGDATGLLPDRDTLASLLAARGIGKGKKTIVYDDEGGGWAARVLWTLEILGFDDITLLDGGLHAWMASGNEITSGSGDYRSISPETFTLNTKLRATLDDVLASLDDENTVLWDCRSLAEFTGEQLTAKRGGHIPNAIHYEWTMPMNRAEKLVLRPLADIKDELSALGITADKRIITYCQSHHRSSFTYWVGKLLGLDISAYDGAWSEWGNRSDTPVETSNY